MKKKKLYAAFCLCLAVLLVPAASVYSSPMLSYPLVVAQIHSPEELVKFMRSELRFVEDRALFSIEDYWQSPEQLLDLRAGDCEDYALLAQAVLRSMGMEAYTISIYGGEYAHTVAIFRDSKGFQLINEDRLYRVNAASLEDAIDSLHEDWEWAAIAEKRGTRGWKIREIRPA